MTTHNWYVHSYYLGMSANERRRVQKYLRIVLQDDSNVHVDNDQECQNEVADHEADGRHVVAAVARASNL